MRRYGLFSGHHAYGRSFAATSLALCLLGLVIQVHAQDPNPSLASLPTAPSPSQELVSSPNQTDHSLTFGRRARILGHDLFNPETIIGPAFGAGIGQWEDEPPGWRQGAEGYGKRFGSGLARHAIGETIQFGFAAVDGEDPRYFLSEDRSFWGRAKHAIASTFVSQTGSGRRIPAFSRFAGTYGSAFISNEWYPANRATASYAARRGSTALAASIGFHLLREFSPFFRHTPE